MSESEIMGGKSQLDDKQILGFDLQLQISLGTILERIEKEMIEKYRKRGSEEKFLPKIIHFLNGGSTLKRYLLKYPKSSRTALVY